MRKKRRVECEGAKVRANNYGILADYYGELFGKDEGANIAAGDAGPLDEAYVGGAS